MNSIHSNPNKVSMMIIKRNLNNEIQTHYDINSFFNAIGKIYLRRHMFSKALYLTRSFGDMYVLYVRITVR